MVLSVPDVMMDSVSGHVAAILCPMASNPSGSVLITALPEEHEITLSCGGTGSAERASRTSSHLVPSGTVYTT